MAAVPPSESDVSSSDDDHLSTVEDQYLAETERDSDETVDYSPEEYTKTQVKNHRLVKVDHQDGTTPWEINKQIRYADQEATLPEDNCSNQELEIGSSDRDQSEENMEINKITLRDGKTISMDIIIQNIKKLVKVASKKPLINL